MLLEILHICRAYERAQTHLVRVLRGDDKGVHPLAAVGLLHLLSDPLELSFELSQPRGLGLLKLLCVDAAIGVGAF